MPSKNTKEIRITSNMLYEQRYNFTFINIYLSHLLGMQFYGNTEKLGK
jgi:hypothetical protein